MSAVRKQVIERLRYLSGPGSMPDPDDGICGDVWNHTGTLRETENILHQAFLAVRPGCHPYDPLGDFFKTPDGLFWSGDYGVRRRKLAEDCADYLESQS